jgi:hypothetical protein
LTLLGKKEKEKLDTFYQALPGFLAHGIPRFFSYFYSDFEAFSERRVLLVRLMRDDVYGVMSDG